MDKQELASELVRRGAVAPYGLLLRGKKATKKMGISEMLAEFHAACKADGEDPAMVIFPFWKPDGNLGCIECKAPTKFLCLRQGYAKLCAECSDKKRTTKITATKRRIRQETGEYPGVKKALEHRRQKYGRSMMSADAKLGAADRMRGIRSRFKEFTGVDNPSQLSWVQEKKNANSMKRYGVLYQQKHLGPEAIAKLDDPAYLESKSSIDIERETGVSQSHLSKILARHGLSPERSSFERSFHDWLDGLGISYEKNLRKKFEMREMDVVVESSKLCIELNGLYWHSKSDDRMYHLDKTQAAERAGYRLFHVWEDDWRERREIIQSMIGSRIGMNMKAMARGLEKRKVDPREANAFFERTHLQGKSARITGAYGLYDADDKLVSCIGIGKSRFKPGHEELIRFSTALGLTVAGGFTKMLSMVENPLMSYCRLDVSTGAGYVMSGWKLLGQTRPGYWYTDKLNRFSRFRFQKHLITSRDDPRPEWQVMKEDRNLSRIWDCGQLVFSWIPR